MSGCILRLSSLHSPVFLVNSCLDLFSAPRRLRSRDPFSRSYGVNLPSSLTVNLSSALVYSTRPRVSVYGTGHSGCLWRLAAFLGSRLPSAIRLARRPRGTVTLQLTGCTSLPRSTPLRFNALFRQCAGFSLLRPRFAQPKGVRDSLPFRHRLRPQATP